MIPSPLAPVLPADEGLQVEHLSHVFATNSTPYKFCMLKALLTLTCEGKQDSVVTFVDLRREMLTVAWIPRLYYRLKFGLVDRFSLILDEVHGDSEERGDSPDYIIDDIREHITANEPRIKKMACASTYERLVRYAPYRLLAPWFEREVSECKEKDKNQRFAELSRELFESRRPLYRISPKGHRRFLEIHPDWHDYLKVNYHVIRGWLDFEWLRFLEPRNSGVPNLVDKLWAYQGERGSLAAQRKFWRPVLAGGFECIYTGAQVDPKRYALDHFLPWSCVVHNRLWNLVPTAPEFNSRKSDRLPKVKHIDIMANAHVQAIKHDLAKGKPDKRALHDYADWLDLEIEPGQFDEGRFRHVYVEKMTTHLNSARWQGFREIILS